MSLWVVLSLTLVLALGQMDPRRFKPYLDQNKMKQCATSPTQVRMPKSYNVPSNYYDGIPMNQRIPPGQNTQPTVVPSCNRRLIQPAALNAYQFETEKYITSIGLNIYDGACWEMAQAVLGDLGSAEQYQNGIIGAAKTCQFTDIRGDTPCKGVIVQGQCSDPDQTGVCGFCYGDGSNRTMPKQHAWTFRSISDYWSLEGTSDLRCPDLGHTWTWNDYKPVLGENSWANMIAPLQIALRKYGSVQAIPDNDVSLQLAINMLPSLDATAVGAAWGAIAYSPRNTLLNPNYDYGFEVSLENNISLLGGLKMLRYVLQTKNIYQQFMPLINKHIGAIETFAKMAFDPSLGYFRQGGILQKDGTFVWNTGDISFAVDCQTWTMSQLGPVLVNNWFGPGAAASIWNKTKELGGYHYQSWSGNVDGLGFAKNADDQAFSGEWTLGAINMLRVFANELNNPNWLDEATNLRQQIEWKLTEDATIDGVKTRQIKYVNKRYYIPFGWWANPIGSTASVSWAVFLDSNWNPLHLGGAYVSQY